MKWLSICKKKGKIRVLDQTFGRENRSRYLYKEK